jgi:hypothetical protein
MARSGDSRERAGQQAGQDIIAAQRKCGEMLAYVESTATGDLSQAVLLSRIDDSNPVPEIHGALLTYYRLFETIIVINRYEYYTGERYDEPIAKINVPQPPFTADFNRTRTETIDGLGDLEDWSFRQMTPQGATKPTRVFLSPRAIKNVYRELVNVQTDLDLHAQTRARTSQATDDRLKRNHE